MSVSRHDGLLVDMINESIEEIIIHVTRFRKKHVARIRIQVTRIRIQNVTRIQIQHVMRIRILHVNRIDLVQRRTTVNEDGGAEVDIILS